MTPDPGRGTTADAGRTASDLSSPFPVVVREAGVADAGAMVELRAVMFEGMGTAPAAIADPGWRRLALDWFTDRAEDPGTRVVVAQVAGQVVSGAVGEVTALIPGPNTVTGSVGLISNVATLPGHRGRGLAVSCTDDLLRWFVEETDVRRIDLFATEAGAHIYTRRGFTVRGFDAMCLPVPR